MEKKLSRRVLQLKKWSKRKPRKMRGPTHILLRCAIRIQAAARGHAARKQTIVQCSKGRQRDDEETGALVAPEIQGGTIFVEEEASDSVAAELRGLAKTDGRELSIREFRADAEQCVSLDDVMRARSDSVVCLQAAVRGHFARKQTALLRSEIGAFAVAKTAAVNALKVDETEVIGKPGSLEKQECAQINLVEMATETTTTDLVVGRAKSTGQPSAVAMVMAPPETKQLESDSNRLPCIPAVRVGNNFASHSFSSVGGEALWAFSSSIMATSEPRDSSAHFLITSEPCTFVDTPNMKCPAAPSVSEFVAAIAQPGEAQTLLEWDEMLQHFRSRGISLSSSQKAKKREACTTAIANAPSLTYAKAEANAVVVTSQVSNVDLISAEAERTSITSVALANSYFEQTNEDRTAAMPETKTVAAISTAAKPDLVAVKEERTATIGEAKTTQKSTPSKPHLVLIDKECVGMPAEEAVEAAPSPQTTLCIKSVSVLATKAKQRPAKTCCIVM
jgi:hypothetical protein